MEVGLQFEPGMLTFCYYKTPNPQTITESITTAQTYFILLHFALLYSIDIAFFVVVVLQIENFCQLCVKKSIGATFPTVLAHFMSLGHILVIFAIFQTFSLLLYLWWWSVISDLWCSYYKKITTCWRLRWWLAFFSRVFFLIKVCVFGGNKILLLT